MQDDIIQTEVTEESAALEENFFDDAWDEDTAPVEEETEEPEANQQPEVNEHQSEAAEAEEHSENTANESKDTAPTHPEEKEDTFTLRYMKEDKQYSRNDTIILAQKGLDYDRVRAERDTLKSEIPTFKEYKSFLEELASDSGVSVDQLMENVRATRLVERERKAGNIISETAAKEQIQREKSARDKDNAVQEDEIKPEEAPVQKTKDIDVASFIKVFPDVKADDIPESVWIEVMNGADLTSAYTRYENKQLRNRIAAIEQNQKNAERSTGSRKTTGNNQTYDDFDAAWDME